MLQTKEVIEIIDSTPINLKITSQQIVRLQNRLDNLYTDNLDGRITQDFWQEKHNQWHDEKDKLIEKLRAISNTSRTFDEGSNLLENFCKFARTEFLRANGKKNVQF